MNIKRMPDGRVFKNVTHVQDKGWFKRGRKLTDEETIRETGLTMNGLTTRQARYGLTAVEAYNVPRNEDGKRTPKKVVFDFVEKVFRPWYAPEAAPEDVEEPTVKPNGHDAAAPQPLPPGVMEVRLVTIDPVRFAELVNSIGAIRELLEELVERAGPRRRP